MPRKGPAPRRELVADPIYRSVVVTQLINKVMLHGKRSIAEKIVYDAMDLIAQTAFDVNRRQQNIGARRLYTILEKVFETISFDAPDLPEKKVTITADYVRDRLEEVLKDEDLSKFIL